MKGKGWLKHIESDAMASVVVFLVALPLCMGIAIASGAPVASGLITGIVGGLVTGALAGCPLQVSGPAAGLTIIVYEIIQRLGLEMLGPAVLIAGAIQLVAGGLRLGQWFRAVSPAVIKGMLAGIGILIFASQFHVMIDDKPRESGIANLVTIPQAVWKAVSSPPDFETEQDRRLETSALRQVGELHRRQIDLQQEVAKHVAYFGSATGEGADPLRGTLTERVARSKLVARQEAILKQLRSVVDGLPEPSTKSGGAARIHQMGEVIDVAQQRQEASLAALREARLDDAREHQAETVAALEGVLGGMKNHGLAAQLGVLTIVSILLWQAFAPRRMRFVPAPLVAVSIATLAAAALSLPVLYVEVPDNLWDEVRLFDGALLAAAPWREVLQAGLLIAVVASAETLLCASAVDGMQNGPRTKYDKELASQGVGNMVCGLFGALPMTGVIVRSSANVYAGAKTRLSAILHGVWLLVFVVGLAFLLRLIPTASLAAVLVYTGYKLVDLKSVRALRKYGWGEVAIYAATVVTIVVADLLTGVLVGVALAVVKLLYTFSHLKVELQSPAKSHQRVLRLEGAATFIRLPRLAAALENVPRSTELHVDMEHLEYIDHACLDLLLSWAKQHEASGGTLVVDWDHLHASFRRENGSARPKLPKVAKVA
jgi:MFS superfamily sulfate permease-like transporter